MWKEYYMFRISDTILYSDRIKIVEILKRLSVYGFEIYQDPHITKLGINRNK